MKTTFAAQPPLSRQDRSPLATKILLALVFMLGAAIIALGIAGQRAFDTSGFSAEAAYSAIHALSRDTKTAWEKKLQPQLFQIFTDFGRGLVLLECNFRDLMQLMLQFPDIRENSTDFLFKYTHLCHKSVIFLILNQRL